MTEQRLNLVAGFKDNASAGVRKLGKTLGDVQPPKSMLMANKWMKDFSGTVDDTIKRVEPVSGLLSGIGVGGLAAGLSMREVVKVFRNLADSTATMKELGRQSAMTTTDIARLQYAAKSLHVDPSAMTNAIGGWSSKMLEFRNHVGDAYRYLNSNGNGDIAAKIIGEDPEMGFKDTLGYLSRIPAAAMKAGKSAADAVQIQRQVAEKFGMGDLMPMLSKGPEGLADAYAEAAREVRPVTKELEDQAERLNKSLNRFDQTWSNFKTEFGPTVISGISGAVDQLTAVLGQVDAAKNRYSSDKTNVTKDAIANENAIGSNFVKHWKEVFRGERPILPNPFDSRSWQFPNPNDGLFDYTKGGDGEAPSGITLSKPGQTRFGEDGNALHRWDEMQAGGRPSASSKWTAPSRYDQEVRARGASMAQQLFATVREGSKEGIIAGLREMAQQQELSDGGKSFGGAEPGHGGHAGMPNLRYGRRPAGGGYRRGPGANDAGPGGAFNPRQAEKAGTYRPEYKLSKADLSDYVVNTVNGEATSSAESIDAVINNMMNRVGSKGWGPSGNLQDVASAPGQYAGHRQATPQAAERIRARIRAIASGGVPDNTNGSNAYRAAWYHGKWYQQHAGDGRVVGGNRFAYEPWTKNGPYAPYPASKAAADAFAARQKALNGAPPQAHAAGGAIRGPGGPRSDSILSWLSNGEFVVNAGAAGRFGPLLHAINDGRMPAYADGGPVGFGVDRRFYPTSSPRISEAEGAGNRRFWRDFFRRPQRDGGMGAPWRTTLAALAMMQGESGRGLNSKTYGWDVNGPSGGVDQLHDVTTGRGAGKLHRLSELMRLAYLQHADWRDPSIQAANFKREALGGMNFAWRRMLAAKTARGALKEGIDKFENPADHEGELRRRMPNIVRLQREATADGAMRRGEADPVEVNIRHHPHTGRPIVTGRAGRGVKLGIRTAPTMRPT